MSDNINTIRNFSSGDRAVNGLLGGFFGGLAMAGVIILAGLLAGDAWQQAVTRFIPLGQQSLLQGILLHLGVSAVYGIVYGLLLPLIPRRVPGWLAGLAYGLLLFSLAQLIILPQTGSGLANLPVWALAAAHAVFGLVLGWRSPRFS